MPSEPMPRFRVADATEQDSKIADTDNSNRPEDGPQTASQDPDIEYVDAGEVL